MLLVETYVKDSSIAGAGLGCYAAEFIPKDTLIWVFDGEIDRKYSKAEYDLFTSSQKAFIDTYAYMNDEHYYLCVDNGRFFNHSEQPNTYESKTEQKTYTLVDIQKNDEIVSDYSHFGITPADHIHNKL
jgi:SET domain-containing protein